MALDAPCNWPHFTRPLPAPLTRPHAHVGRCVVEQLSRIMLTAPTNHGQLRAAATDASCQSSKRLPRCFSGLSSVCAPSAIEHGRIRSDPPLELWSTGALEHAFPSNLSPHRAPPSLAETLVNCVISRLMCRHTHPHTENIVRHSRLYVPLPADCCTLQPRQLPW